MYHVLFFPLIFALNDLFMIHSVKFEMTPLFIYVKLPHNSLLLNVFFSISTNYNLVFYNVQVSFTQGKTHMFVKLIGVWDNNCFLRKRIPLHGRMWTKWVKLLVPYYKVQTLQKPWHFQTLLYAYHHYVKWKKKHFFIERSLFNFKYVYKDLDIRFLVWKVINKYKIFL